MSKKITITISPSYLDSYRWVDLALKDFTNTCLHVARGCGRATLEDFFPWIKENIIARIRYGDLADSKKILYYMYLQVKSFSPEMRVKFDELL